ncbi:MAG: DUF218 domain-containing protein [Epulopiscium sp.]|nr:DUF218 domain-containing protein [Candidatus Epulonipiscium sp.]
MRISTGLRIRRFIRWIKKVLLISVATVVVSIVTVFGINNYVQVSVKDKIIPSVEDIDFKADCILILGAGIWNNSTPSHMLEDRLLQGIELYDMGASDRLLMSGDHGRKEYDEVNVMKKFAIDLGVPSEHIFMDHAGFSTYESIYRARDIFKAEKIFIVTQEYHLYRALYVAKSLGLEAYGVPSDPRQYIGQDYRNAREVLARVKDFTYGIFKPKPKYIGEVIPVSGDGNLTND